MVTALAFAASAVFANDYASEWGPKVGTPLPVIDAQDQVGEGRNLDNLAGENGLLLFMNRSADW